MSPDRACSGGPSRRSGFTLIELLVVIGIISVLIGALLVVVPKVKRAVYSASTQAELSAIAGAIQQYYNDYKAYPGPLPNSQLNVGADGGTPPYLVWNGASVALHLNTLAPFANSNYDPTDAPSLITSSQNLVLGLFGGLELQTNSTGITGFVYNPQDIFSDGATPAPRGPASLNYVNPKRQQAYMSVKPGELSTPNTSYNSNAGASFADDANRSPLDAMIPVFLDKYSDPLPILYYRTNVGATAIVGFRNNSTIGGPQLTVTPPGGTQTNVTAQYDLLQNLPYTASKIGTNGSNPASIHGLIGLGNANNLSDPIDSVVNGISSPSTNGSNGIAYFKDPTLNPPYDAMVANPPNNTYLGVARQKDGFVLISAGPDRLYGTHDDNIYPGPLQP